MSDLISFGAGVNSVAMTILLVSEGWRGPIVFADTGCEWPETYCYLEQFDREWLAPRGLSVTRLQGLPWQRVHGGATLIGYCEERCVVPQAAVRWCTIEWKVNPIGRWASANGIDVQLIGIAADESHRQPLKRRPLVDRNVTRQGCIDIITAEGLDVPQKSGCYIPDLRAGIENASASVWEQAENLDRLGLPIDAEQGRLGLCSVPLRYLRDLVTEGRERGQVTRLYAVVPQDGEIAKACEDLVDLGLDVVGQVVVNGAVDQQGMLAAGQALLLMEQDARVRPALAEGEVDLFGVLRLGVRPIDVDTVVGELPPRATVPEPIEAGGGLCSSCRAHREGV